MKTHKTNRFKIIKYWKIKLNELNFQSDHIQSAYLKGIEYFKHPNYHYSYIVETKNNFVTNLNKA
jgi:hypothetical protein